MKPLPAFAAALALAASVAPTSALALFKVVAPDGTVTYTDRPPDAGQGRSTRIEPALPPAGESVALPLALREASRRFPVTLYTIANCPPCDQGRELLRRRGVPFSERRSEGEEDRQAWINLIGSLEAPALTIGNQVLRAFSTESWNSYLDAAGYPTDSKLPANYRPPPPAPLVQRSPVRAAPPTDDAATAEPAPVPVQLPEPASGIRF